MSKKIVKRHIEAELKETVNEYNPLAATKIHLHIRRTQ